MYHPKERLQTQKVNLYDHGALKRILDDSTKAFLLYDAKVKENHLLWTLQILLSVICIGIGGFEYLQSKKLPFAKSFNITVVNVIVHGICSVALMGVMFHYRKENLISGTLPNGKVIKIGSKMKKYDEEYTLVSNEKPELKINIKDVFVSNGFLSYEALSKILRNHYNI